MTFAEELKVLSLAAQDKQQDKASKRKATRSERLKPVVARVLRRLQRRLIRHAKMGDTAHWFHHSNDLLLSLLKPELEALGLHVEYRMSWLSYGESLYITWFDDEGDDE